MSKTLLALKRAIRAALAADPALAALTGSIHDEPPAMSRFPYLTFGEAGCHDWGTDDTGGNEVLLTLHGWSRGRGSGEALTIADRVASVLHEAELALEGCRLVSLRLAASDSEYIPAARAHHVALHLRALVELD